MRGWLIVNEFLQSNKFNEIHNWLQEAAINHGIQLELKTNAQLLIDLSDCKGILEKKLSSASSETDHMKEECVHGLSGMTREDAEFILFWDKDIRLAKHLENMGYPVFNSSKAIGICDDKSLTHQVLMNSGIPMPRTIIAPMTFANIGYTNHHFLEEVADRLGFPMVVKECFGSFGQQVYLVNSLDDLKNKVTELGAKPILFQQFIKESFGKDIRLQVVGGKVIASMYRYSVNGDFRANLAIGGRMQPHTPTDREKELALRCCDIIGLDYAGVDLLFGEDGSPLVCEVNSNAHFKNIYDCTGVNAADAILSYIKNRIVHSWDESGGLP